MMNKFFIVILIIFISLGVVKGQKTTFHVDSIKVDSSISFGVKNISLDTLYLLNDWSITYFAKDRRLQIKTYPRFGGMPSYDVELIRILPNEIFYINEELLWEETPSIDNITVIIVPIEKEKILTLVHCLNEINFMLNNRKAIDLLKAKSLIFAFEKYYKKIE